MSYPVSIYFASSIKEVCSNGGMLAKVFLYSTSSTKEVWSSGGSQLPRLPLLRILHQANVDTRGKSVTPSSSTSPSPPRQCSARGLSWLPVFLYSVSSTKEVWSTESKSVTPSPRTSHPPLKKSWAVGGMLVQGLPLLHFLHQGSVEHWE